MSFLDWIVGNLSEVILGVVCQEQWHLLFGNIIWQLQLQHNAMIFNVNRVGPWSILERNKHAIKMQTVAAEWHQGTTHAC
ncbi:hypothetical protein V6N12_069810 [Hibiscus sabdariffa]|uniref:Uncharacterized protein n=1 Tax=Hibiscus sabdariffa TaxID=183260 RepID=A0ABR2FF16_9ROSI